MFSIEIECSTAKIVFVSQNVKNILGYNAVSFLIHF